MDATGCQGCAERDARVADLERRLAEVEARLGEVLAKLKTNASNSSLPPSANPPGADKPVKKEKSERKRGGPPDHPPHLKQLLPSERVTDTKLIVPDTCAKCQAKLRRAAGPDDPEPKLFQTVEISEIPVEVVEYQAHARTCACCRHVTCATIPAEIRTHSVGPRLTATLAYLTGCHGISKRGVEEIVETMFGVPISLGTVANLEQEVSAAWRRRIKKRSKPCARPM